MSDETIIALTSAVLTAIPPTLIAAAAFWQGRKNGVAAIQLAEKSDAIVKTVVEKSDKVIKQNEDLEQQNTQIIEKSDEIHGLTNSNLERVSGELTSAHQEIKELKELIGKLASDGEETRAYARQEMGKDRKK